MLHQAAELGVAWQALKDAVWEQREWFAFWLGTVWFGVALIAFALHG
jgi:hypothetical protein